MKPTTARMLFTAAFLALTVLVSGTAWGAMGEVTSFAFRTAQDDVLGLERSLELDGKPDAHFVLSLKGIGAISDVSLRTVDGKREWSPAASGDRWTMVVRDTSGKTVSSESGMPITPFLGFATLNLYDSDDGTAFSETREYEVSVKFIDGSTTSAKIEVKGMPDVFGSPEPLQPESGVMTATVYGIGNRDVAGKRETLGKDGTNDAHFRVRFTTISVVDQITIRNVDGTNAMWDTVSGNGAWAIAVFQEGKLRNKADGSVRFAVDGDTTLDLWVADNGAVSGGKTRFEVIIKFNDGTTFREIASPGTPEVEASVEDILSAVLYAPATTDIANRGETPGVNGTPDWRITLSVAGEGTIISFIVRGIEGSVAEWDTLPGNKKPIAVVTDSAGKILNSSNGSVSIPLSGRKDLSIWLDDAGALSDGANKFRVIAVLSDGRTFERLIERAATQTSVPPGSENVRESDSVRAFYMGKGPRNLIGKGEPADITKGLDANPDAHIRLRLVSLNGTIDSLTVESLNGNGGDWDTIPGNGRWHIAVTETAIGPVLNKNDGSFSKKVSGNSEFHLWLADNGKLSANPSSYRVIVRFSDGRALSQNLF
jgi:hypothetical protein